MRRAAFCVLGIMLLSLWVVSIPYTAPKVDAVSNKVVVQVHCFEGFKFLYLPNGNIVQLLNEYGQGVPCGRRKM